MNSDKHSSLRQRGNAMIYILLSLALIGALTAVISRQNDQASSSLDDEQAELLASQILTYTTDVQNTINGMLMSGIPVTSLDFTRPSEAGFDTAPTINKVYHPDGGGLNDGPISTGIFNETTNVPLPGWYLGRYNNVTWTPTANNDVLLVTYKINQSVCQRINKKITGDATIPIITSGALSDMLLSVAAGGGGQNLTVSGCTTYCDGKPSLCISNLAGNGFAFYSIISGQ